MQDTINNPDNSKNIYVIKHKLAALQLTAASSCFTYYVGDFVLRIYTPVSNSFPVDRELRLKDRITNHDVVYVNLYELKNNPEGGRYEDTIYYSSDSRFKNYYQLWFADNPYSTTKISIINLCEMIRYLHRLSNLMSFI